MHLIVKAHHEKIMEETLLLKQLHHKHDINNNAEGFNEFLMKFPPEDRTCCQTIKNKARIASVVGLQSTGCRQFCGCVFECAGIEVDEDDMMSLFLRSRDAECRKVMAPAASTQRVCKDQRNDGHA
jgi:hypothetical protein